VRTKLYKSKYWQKTHKYGVRVPKNVREAREIDDKNGNTLWQDAISMEMKNNRIAFEDFDGNIQDLKGYEQIPGHLVETPASITYSTVVSRESV